MMTTQSTNPHSKPNSKCEQDVILPTPTLWLIDDDPALRLILDDNFSSAEINGQPINVISFSNAHGAWVQLNEIKAKSNQSQNSSLNPNPNPNPNDTSTPTNLPPHAIITDIRMPMMDGLSFSQWLSKEFPDISTIIMTAHSDLQSAIDSYQTGAFEYLPKPFDLDEAVTVVQKAISRNIHYQKQLTLANKLINNPLIEKPKPNNLPKNPNKKEKKNSKQGNTKPENKYSATSDNNQVNKAESYKGIIGQSVAMQNVFRAVGRLAHSPITVLVTGESGTGKELIANALHQTSLRQDKLFIALNMSAIPHDLIESELFGHEKGAFTGATSCRKGRFEQADGGTLFLDEIGDMPFNTQTRLLRVLANGEFFRVGGKDPIKVDVRIISATHQNLENLVKQGKFREDLFYRLNVIRLPLPPLRDRQEDIPTLTEFFLQKSAKDLNSEQKKVDATAMQVLQSYRWSGNVRQLENICRWLTVMTSGETVYLDDLPPELLSNGYGENINQGIENYSSKNTFAGRAQDLQDSGIINVGLSGLVELTDQKQEQVVEKIVRKIETEPLTATWQQLLETWTAQQIKSSSVNNDFDENNTDTGLLSIALPEFEKVMINTTLLHCKGHKGKASEILGWGRNTLSRKIKQLGLDDRW